MDTNSSTFYSVGLFIQSIKSIIIFWTIFWDKTVEDGFHVYPNIWICILVDA